MFSFNDIIISSGFFGKDRLLSNIVNRRFNLVFGRNGCGKSTIASAIDQYAKGKFEPETNELRFDKELSDSEKQRIFVFNEQFVRENVEVQADGIEAIVMLGDAIGDSQKIDELEKKLQAASDVVEEQNAIKEESCRLMETLLSQMETLVFKNDPCYASYYRDAHGKKNKRKPDMENDIFRFMTDPLVVGGNPNDLADQVKTKASYLQKVTQGKRVIWSAPTFGIPALVEKAKELLQQHVEKPMLSEREEYIVSLMQQGHDVINSTKTLIIQRNATQCPYCQQDISEDKLTRIKEDVKRIESVLRDKSDKYISEVTATLEGLSVPQSDFLLFPDEVFGQCIRKYEDSVADLSSNMEQLKEQLQLRRNNPFVDSLPFDDALLQQSIQHYQLCVDEMMEQVKKYNNDIDQIAQQLADFDKLNACLACHNIKSLYDQCKAQEERREAATKSISKAKETISECQGEINRLKLTAEQSNFALDYLNSCLSYMFFSNDRLALQAFTDSDSKKGCYRLVARGQSVNPNKVSLGERNAIGLAYFFAKSFSGLSEKKRYQQASFFVIDDPISSFDQGNRVGIITFLREQFYNILKGNDDSKVLILSHDMHTINDLSIVSNELGRSLNMSDDELDDMNDVPYKELSGRGLRPVKKAVGNTYRRLMFDVFEYATAEEPSELPSNDTIGNSMRRLMESYSSFSYGLGFTDMLRDDRVLRNLHDENNRQFYKRLAVNLFLNEESHANNRTDPTDPTDTFFNSTEKQTLARYLLLFIYLTNATHIHFMLKSDKARTISGWKSLLPQASIGSSFGEVINSQEENLIREYFGKTLIVEADAKGNPHCGQCLLPPSAIRYVGESVLLNNVKPNSDYRTKGEYPLFAYFQYSIKNCEV